MFTRIKNSQRILEKITTDYMTIRLRTHLKKANIIINQGDLMPSIHSCRSSGPASRMLEGESLKHQMSKVYWKNPKTAWHYIKLLEVPAVTFWVLS